MKVWVLGGVTLKVELWWLSGLLDAGQRGSVPAHLKGHEPGP